MTKIVVRCQKCHLALTNELERVEYSSQLDNVAEHDYVPLGLFMLEHGHCVVNPKDVINTKHHTDSRRLGGCCGIAGEDGRTTLCLNDHEVGTERSDCWHAHSFTFGKSETWLDRIWQEVALAPSDP